MILGSRELDEFVVEPWMKLEPLDTKLMKKITCNHPYKILLRSLYKYFPSYSNEEENDANPDLDGYDDNIIDFYFRMLNDYRRYGIAFEREFELFPENKLCAIKGEFWGAGYYLVNNHYDKKTLLFNNVKTTDLNDYDIGEKPFTEEERKKIDLIKTMTNKKLQVAMMDPDIFNYSKNINEAMENPKFQKHLIERFNYRMTYEGYDYFMNQDYPTD